MALFSAFLLTTITTTITVNGSDIMSPGWTGSPKRIVIGCRLLGAGNYRCRIIEQTSRINLFAPDHGNTAFPSAEHPGVVLWSSSYPENRVSDRNPKLFVRGRGNTEDDREFTLTAAQLDEVAEVVKKYNHYYSGNVVPQNPTPRDDDNYDRDEFDIILR